MFDGITQDELGALVAQAAPVSLQGLDLLREHRAAPGEIFPRGLEREVYIEAMREMMAYTRQCMETAQMLIHSVPAVPIAQPTEAYCL